MIDESLTRDPIPPLLKRLALPVGVGFFFNTMYNVVDTWFAGGISTTAVAAVSLSFPFFFIIIAVGSGISTGSAALIGHALGRGNRDEGSLIARQTIGFALWHGVILACAGILFSPPLFRAMGAGGEYLTLATSYMGVMFIGAPLFILNQSQNGILNATGDTKSFRNFLIVAFLLNLIYDPWFIYGGLGVPPLGLPGIAWGTVVIQCLGSFYLFSRVVGTGLVGGVSRDLFLPRWWVYRELFLLGAPSSLTMLTVAIGIFVITWFVGRYGSSAVAAYGIGTRIEQIVLLPVMGLNVATLTLTARNAGALLFDRVRETVRHATSLGTRLMLGGMVILAAGGGWLMEIFTNDPSVIDAGRGYLRMAGFLAPAYVILYINSFALQGLKQPRFPLLIGVYRQVLAPLPLLWFLTKSGGVGVEGVWWGIFVVNWSAALMSMLYVRRVMNRLDLDEG